MSEAPGKAFAHQPYVFPVACWVLGLVAFSELIVAGMSLAARLEASQQVRVEVKEVPKYVAVEGRPKAVESDPSIVARAPAAAAPIPVAPQPTPIQAPRIDDPRSERLVADARKARVAGDMVVAITKLKESLKESPDDPSVNYELGLVHEAMGIYDQASAYYEKVFKMGVTKAGALYELSAGKLRDGFQQPDFHGKLALGRVRIFKDTRYDKGERVMLTIPVQKAPAAEIDPKEISVEVKFFNKTSKGEIIDAEHSAAIENSATEWPSMPFDFAGGEEPLRVTYIIPSQDAQTEHLFGEETYYGQVVSLIYSGEVLDVQAWPRDLVAHIEKPPVVVTQQQAPAFDQLPPDFNPDAPLLPTPEAPRIETLPPLPHH